MATALVTTSSVVMQLVVAEATLEIEIVVVVLPGQFSTSGPHSVTVIVWVSTTCLGYISIDHNANHCLTPGETMVRTQIGI